MSDWEDWVLGSVLVLLLGALVFIVVIAVVMIASPKMYLVKEDWKCTADHREHGSMMAGKVTVPTVYTVCDRWERK